MSVKDWLRRNAVKRIAVPRKKELTPDIFPLAYHAPFPELAPSPCVDHFSSEVQWSLSYHYFSH
jgi:hypothetical protein